jgi:hypothetical protein
VALALPLALAGSAAESGEPAGTKAAAALKPQADGEYSPIIIIPGIGQSPVDYYNEDGSLALDDSGAELGGYFKMIVIDPRGIVELLLKELLIPALLTLIFQVDVGFSKSVGKVLGQLLSAHAMNADGTLVNDLRPRRMFKSVADMDQADRDMFYRQIPMRKITDEIGEENAFFFAYSMMGDAVQTAKELREFVEFVKEDTGSEKVSLVNVSLGGSVYVAYLDMYGDKGDLDQVVNLVAVLDGSDVVADLFAREFDLNDRYLYSGLVPALMETLGLGLEEYLTKIFGVALRILPRKTYEKMLTAAFDFLHTNVMINNAQLWATVPLARYKALRDKYLTDDAHKELLKKVDAYFEMQARFDENTRRIVANGTRVNNIAGYGLQFGDVEYFIFGAVASAKTSNADGVIHVASTSQGASSVPAGTQFPENYQQQKPSAKNPDYSYISPNRSVDASTCVLPDNTWFFENQHHEAGRNDIIINLATALLLDPTLENVHSKPAVWPQFNGTARTDWIRRDWLPKLEAIDKSTLTPEVKKQLDEAETAAHALLNGTIADQEKTTEVSKQLVTALRAAGVTEIAHDPFQEEDTTTKILGGLFSFLDEAVYYAVGGRGYSDWWRLPKYPGLFNGEGAGFCD